MAKSKTAFSAAMKKRAAPQPAEIDSHPIGETTATAPIPEPEPSKAKTEQPSRQGKKPIIAYVDKAAHKQLKNLATDLEKSQQDIIIEALNQYFVSHNRPPIA